MNKNILKAAVVASVLGLTANASATIIYDYTRDAGVFGGASGLSYDSVNATYNDTVHELTFTVDYNGDTADGGWLVLSPGDNPKNSTSELGIAYFDAASGNVWTYAYNGENNAASYTSMEFLGFHENAYTTVNGVGTLAIDVTEQNAALESGFAFGERIGIWFHPADNVVAHGDENGLNSFSAYGTGWLDTSGDGNCDNQNTGCIVALPEPSSLLLIGLGAGVMGLRRRLRKS
ncbi:MAG: PEP-CTERM sorting domain-containing protein [Gammaproteobacteria bacterium]